MFLPREIQNLLAIETWILWSAIFLGDECLDENNMFYNFLPNLGVSGFWYILTTEDLFDQAVSHVIKLTILMSLSSTNDYWLDL